ncbi:MAG: type III-A CRISPR-associated RAMP protein Csm5 [Phascolarctobacterium sp.]|uniref:type III-A CRISPR-associated RAMP protein Csm5 n=1 Tax=Phascolarctobacterium sp. TaxID=2049039 RepID=UPI0026DC7132|nr:type III-A CRISPR-associated RAMP protein Csm5 [Phascolarctobacterium sp.]MDO4921634.1 type III-A CRISPR-associated RAMP protein Csm5 [Phascolarctobacterium sp.]
MISKGQNYQETAELCLQVLTPVNISDGMQLLPKDYLYDAKRQTVYFVNYSLWHQFIIEKNLLPSYEKYLLSGDKTKNMLAWLEQQEYSLKDVEYLVSGGAKAEVDLNRIKDKKSVNAINRQVKLVDGTPYVPGSSLKGIFRTAIIYHLLQKNSSVKQKYWRQICDCRYDKKFFKKELEKIAKNLEIDLLHGLKLHDDKDKPIIARNAVNSVLRGLLVSDATAAANVSTVILPKCDLTFDRLGHAKKNDISLFRECIIPGSQYTFTVKLDKTMTAVIGLTSVAMLLQWTQDYFNFVMSLQSKAFGKAYPNLFEGVEQANIFLGSNTGFLSKTILLAVAPEDEAKEAMQVVRELLDVTFRKHKHLSLDKIISPRTLKATIYAGRQVLTGLAKVTVK